MIKSTIHFMRIRNIAFSITVLITVIGIIALFARGLNLGLDFTGGTAVELIYKKPVDIAQLRQDLVKLGYHHSIVQSVGSTEVRITLEEDKTNLDKQADTDKKDNAVDVNNPSATVDTQNADTSSNTETNVNAKATPSFGKILAAKLQDLEPTNPITLKSDAAVSAQVGKELLNKGGIACLLALGGILIYLALRFQWKFGLGAIASLFHDIIVTLGILAIFQIPIDLTVFAAILAMVGYSLNDTIIIYDRIRENFRVLRKASLIENIDVSVTQTLLRTLATSLSTAMALFALLIFGGESLGGFALVMLIGVAVGTYSSIYIAAPVLIWLKLGREDLLPPPSSDDLRNKYS